MKTLLIVLAFLLTFSASAETLNEKILTIIDHMPKAGGYVLTASSPRKLRDAFSWNLEELSINEASATPSYCTTATYIVFFKAMKSYWDENGYPSKEVQSFFKANLESDGENIWGRWNSNGPGTAKFFHDLQLGENFEDLSLAQAGDFLKIYWNMEVGKNERAHSVVFLNSTEDTITFWSSNTSTDGYGIRTIPKSMAKRLLFSRLENPGNASNILNQPKLDEFLASMLTRVSSWEEVKAAVGI